MRPQRQSLETEPLTHLLMCGTLGGKIVLPDILMDEFYAQIARDISYNRTLHIVEKQSPIFKLHFDLDFEEILEPEIIQNLVRTMSLSVKSYYFDSNEIFGSIVCGVFDSCPNVSHSPSRKAPGLHVIYPFVFVEEETALWIRSGVVFALRREFSDAFPNLDWQKVVDLAVVSNTAGLRLVGNDKAKDCKYCHNNQVEKKCCDFCKFQPTAGERKARKGEKGETPCEAQGTNC